MINYDIAFSKKFAQANTNEKKRLHMTNKKQ